MRLRRLTIEGFKSFARTYDVSFDAPITAIVGPNGSGKSNVVESIRFVLGEQSMKSLRGGVGTDLIFKAPRDGKGAPRAVVHMTLDNRDRAFHIVREDNTKLSLDFDEIVISREIHRDGKTAYRINGTEVRLKDILELIASVHIGASGHHIISQGQADHLLRAHAKERKTMLEDALGLKVYQYRLKESERRLARTLRNIETLALRRKEIAPELVFLKKQVGKIERAETLRETLQDTYLQYLRQQEAYVVATKTYHQEQLVVLAKELRETEERIERGRAQKNQESPALVGAREKLAVLLREEEEMIQKKNELAREIGRKEGMVEVLARTSQAQQKEAEELATRASEYVEIARTHLVRDIETLQERLSAALGLSDVVRIHQQIKSALDVVEFLSRTHLADKHEGPVSSKLSHQNNKEKESFLQELAKLQEHVVLLEERLTALYDARQHNQKIIAEEEKQQQSSQEDMLVLAKKETSLSHQIDAHEAQLAHAKEASRRFAEEVLEARVLLGDTVDTYVQIPVDNRLVGQDPQQHSDAHKEILEMARNVERDKIRLEGLLVSGAHEIKEQYEELVARDAQYQQETNDLEASVTALQTTISDIKEKLSHDFDEGMKKVSAYFKEFFVKMFGGGDAKLALVSFEKNTDETEEEGEQEKAEGIEIDVELPNKKVRDLAMLSGGERSLVSIALLFALSQVKPPPFIVLDETDAALDEANSRKYGDLLEKLSEYAQLVLVTHNRETMSRAQVLYGVTIDKEGASQLLSVKLAEAEQYAK